MYCKNCGYEIADDKMFCPNCGSAISNKQNQKINAIDIIGIILSIGWMIFAFQVLFIYGIQELPFQFKSESWTYHSVYALNKGIHDTIAFFCGTAPLVVSIKNIVVKIINR
ncbi:MAG: zinc ribbon domain-containing protein [Lachnospiraceae bacterium]|nr:zinc ribbon domain-containing protein [Lachnospiraceae bacterium]